ncbi:hypothetical protein D9M68_677130 [compost metagenome]
MYVPRISPVILSNTSLSRVAVRRVATVERMSVMVPRVVQAVSGTQLSIKFSFFSSGHRQFLSVSAVVRLVNRRQ